MIYVWILSYLSVYQLGINSVRAWDNYNVTRSIKKLAKQFDMQEDLILDSEKTPRQ